MKKVLLFAAVVAGLGFTSCSKSEECVCTLVGTSTTYTEDDTNGADLEDFCEASNIGATFLGGKCEMK